MENVRGSKTSVHVGCFTTDFLSLIWRDENQIGKYDATGSGACFLANRLSWFFSFEGPSMQVDTACSSGLVALDLACSGLWSGESKMVCKLSIQINPIS
jgi:acyl transferase domain-containing protein